LRARVFWGALTLTALSYPLGADAQTHAQKRARSEGAEPDATPPDPRADVTGYGTAGAVFAGLGFGASLGAGAHVDPQVALELDGLVAAVIFPKASVQWVTLGSRVFVGSSFVFHGGVRLRHLAVELNELFSPFDSDDLHLAVEQTDLGPVFAIGNRFQLDGFFIGVDWIELYMPLAGLHGEEQTIDDRNGEILARERRDMLRTPAFSVLHFQIGFTP
jgi:hypothetical protein